MTWENRLTLEVLSPSGWVDLSTRVNDVIEAVQWARGRQNNLDQSEPGAMTALLNNSDDALTFGNTSSPYAAWWGPGLKIRLRERVGQFTFDQFTGFVQVAEEILVTSGVEQRVRITATDRLGRLRQGRAFVSTLTEYIRYAGGTTLRQYWPCLEQSGAIFRNLLASTGSPPIDFSTASANFIVPTAGTTAIIAGGAEPVLTDDVAPVLVTAATGISGGLETVAATNDYRVEAGPSFAVAAGQIVTMVAWYRPQLPAGRSGTALAGFADTQGSVTLRTVDNAGTLNLFVLGTLSATVVGPVLPDQIWTPVALRYGWDTALIELWVGSNRYTGVLTGVPAGPEFAFSQQVVCTFYAGAFAHIQFYVGNAADWDFTKYLDQYRTAQTGLDRQTTGDRIRAVLSYAGVPTSEQSQVDTGVAVMATAALAGKDPLAALSEAETTDQGLIYADGSGQVTFADRRRLYTI